MPDGALTALQKGLVAAAKAHPNLSALIGDRILDAPPHQETAFPYVVLRRFELEPGDTDGTTGFLVTFGPEVHSRKTPPQTLEAKRVGEQLVAAFHRQEGSISLIGFDLVRINFLTSSAEPENGDGDVIHRLAFEAHLDTAT